VRGRGRVLAPAPVYDAAFFIDVFAEGRGLALVVAFFAFAEGGRS
jgi:hypothetical protein